jgi:hypothetical protein
MKKKALLFAGVGTAAVVWAGLRTPVRPRPINANARGLDTVAVPADLPAPVARYFQLTAGDAVPVAVAPAITGTARMAVPGLPFRLWMQARWQARYQPGRAFTRVMELGFFGRPVLRAVDHYEDGMGSLTVGGKREAGPNVDQAADLVLWAESVWMPSVLFTTPGLRWQAVDETRARLLVPYGKREHEITWHFDAGSGLLTHLTSFRFKSTQSRWKTAWRVDMRQYATFQQIRIPSSIAITWEDEGRPWAIFDVADMAYDSPVSEAASLHDVTADAAEA